MLVELGGGTRPHPKADVIIDLHHPKNAPPQDASNTPWRVSPTAPAGTVVGELLVANCADEVYSSHFMEHIPRGQQLIDVMNEAWRVLKPGGTFTMVVPLVGYTGNDGKGHMVSGWQPYADPTHVNFWWFPEALLYFCEGPFKPNANYGIHVWKQLGGYLPDATENSPGSWWSVRNGWEGLAKLIKP
jgi:SAM-dependent methyltransferase